jgi:hypothetical protein
MNFLGYTKGTPLDMNIIVTVDGMLHKFQVLRKVLSKLKRRS